MDESRLEVAGERFPPTLLKSRYDPTGLRVRT